MNNYQRKGVSILIPLYNEEKILIANIEKLVEFLNGTNIPYEIILCDNGSTDKTPILAKKLESKFVKKVKFLSVPQRGVGLAFKEMVKNAFFNNLISLDADLSIDFRHFILSCLTSLKNNSMVIG
jgi:glycosyltransferase involved in cell wall biosynthesis